MAGASDNDLESITFICKFERTKKHSIRNAEWNGSKHSVSVDYSSLVEFTLHSYVSFDVEFLICFFKFLPPFLNNFKFFRGIFNGQNVLVIMLFHYCIHMAQLPNLVKKNWQPKCICDTNQNFNSFFKVVKSEKYLFFIFG